MSRRAEATPTAPPLAPATPTLNAAQLLEACFGREPAGWVILVDLGGYAVLDAPCRFQHGRWRLLGGYRAGAEPGLQDYLGRGAVGFRPIRRREPDYTGLLLPTRVLWGVVKIQRPPTRPNEPLPRREADDVAAVRARFLGCPVPPTILLDQGAEVAGLWMLREPLDDLARVSRLLFLIARRLDAGPESSRWLVDRVGPTDPRQAHLMLPGAVSGQVYPPVTVTAELVAKTPVDADALERALGA